MSTALHHALRDNTPYASSWCSVYLAKGAKWPHVNNLDSDEDLHVPVYVCRHADELKKAVDRLRVNGQPVSVLLNGCFTPKRLYVDEFRIKVDHENKVFETFSVLGHDEWPGLRWDTKVTSVHTVRLTSGKRFVRYLCRLLRRHGYDVRYRQQEA